jgi:hypothetical protein
LTSVALRAYLQNKDEDIYLGAQMTIFVVMIGVALVVGGLGMICSGWNAVGED